MAGSGIVKTTNSRAPEFLADLLAHTKQTLMNHGFSEEQADLIAREISIVMRHTWGGQQIYFPHWLRESLSERDRQIYDEFTGGNHSELASKYHVSVQWVYKIVKSVQAEEVARRQITLDL